MESKLRIPRVATAVLVLGGACGGDDEPSPLDAKGIDTSDGRKEAVAEAVCKRLLGCDDGDRRIDLPSCTASVQSYFEDYVGADATDDCMDALLDYYSCYSTLSCEELDYATDAGRDCAFETRFDERCESQLDDVDDPPVAR